MQQSESALGLRERKRLATRRQIETSAVSLVLEHGYDAVTVDMICDAATISTRTFFNYFPGKDAAVVGELISIPTDEAIDAVLAEHEPDLLTGVVRVFESTAMADDGEADLLLARHRIIKSHPDLMHRHFARMNELEEALTRVVETRLRAQGNTLGDHVRSEIAPDEQALALVMTAGAAMKYAFRRWQATGRRGSRADMLAPAFELMAAIIRRNQPGPPTAEP